MGFALLPLLWGLAAGEALLEAALAGRASLAEVADCSRRSAEDLGPALQRLPGRNSACGRVARQLYCEAVQDVFEPWPLQKRCDAGQEQPATALRAEGPLRLAFLVFMVDEFEAVKELLQWMGGGDSALVHVDRRQLPAFKELAAWAEDKGNIKVKSSWAVQRIGYSAAASLLEMVDRALEELPTWDVLLFLSASHFPIRPRWELERYLWYHDVSFVSSDEGLMHLENVHRLQHHLKLGVECEGELYDPLWNGSSHGSTILPGLGHPNITVAHGPPFVALRRGFAQWLSNEQKQKGSAVWVLLRHSLRTWCNIEKALQTVVENSCYRGVNKRHDLTVARQGVAEQQQHHTVTTNDGFAGPLVLSAAWLSPNDYAALANARRDQWVATGFPGAIGQQPIGSSPAFVAFARKVDGDLRALLKAPAFEAATNEPWDWPLAERAWQLLSECGAEGLQATKRGCGQVGDRAPCALDVTLSAEGCDSMLRVKEKVAVGSGRVFAVQMGAGWLEAKQAFRTPNLLPSDAAMQVQFSAAARQNSDLEASARARALFQPPSKSTTFLVEPEFDLREAHRGGSVSFWPENATELESGEWRFIMEALGDRSLYSPLSERLLAVRPFFVYKSQEEVTLEVLERYFAWEMLPAQP